ncbi:MAG: site-specific integrase [Dokdonella sp.]
MVNPAAMRLAHHLLRHASGVYHFRLIVPADLRASVGLRVIKRSLRTADPVVARAYAYALGARYAGAFAAFRDEAMPKPPPLADILRSLERGDVRTYTLRTPSGMHIRADGPEDHARALEAIGRLAALPLTTTAAAVPAAVVQTSGISAGEAARKYLATLDAATIPAKTRSQKRAAVNGFCVWKGEKTPLDKVSRTDVSEWIQSLRNAGIATPTLANKQSYLTAFFEWSQNAGHYAPGDNPATGHVKQTTREKRLRRKGGFRPFTTADIHALYSPEALGALNEQTRWGAVIGLYTGARVSEVGQIALADFFTNDEGIWCVRITDEGDGQSLKNDASNRTVPIHPHLLALGLRERVARLSLLGEKQLFPRAKAGSVNGMGNWLSKAYGRHLDACGVKPNGPGKIGFHSLRKTAIKAMKDVGVSSEARAQYVGHELDDEHHGAYGSEFTTRALLEGIDTGPCMTAGIGSLSFGLDVEALKRVL